MKCKVLIYCLLFVCNSYAQVENNVFNSAPATNAEQPAVIELNTESEMLEEDQKSSVNTRSESKVKVKSAEKQVVPAPVMEQGLKDKSGYGSNQEQLQQQYRSQTIQFTSTKEQSSYQRTQRSPNEYQQKSMDDAVDYFESNAPNTFEYHYFYYVSGNYNLDRVDHLFEAQKLKPENSDVILHLGGYYIIKSETAPGLKMIEKLIKNGRLTQSNMHYATDLLTSVQKNGVLITHGFEDTYAAWYVQNSMNFRKDVKIVSLDFLQSEEYRTSLQKDGLNLPDQEIIDNNYLSQFCSINESQGIAISLTTPKEYFVPIQNKLFVVGLVFIYSNEPINNFYKNELLWNVEMKKELLKSANNEKSKKMLSNYLPMLLQMRQTYQLKSDVQKLNSIDESIDKLGAMCNKYEQVQKIKGSY